jgi:hypothetical protein
VARGIDLSALSPAERAIAGSGLALFVDGFLPWWYRIRTPSRTYLHNAGLTGWGLIAVVIGFLVVVMAVAHTVHRGTRGRHDYAFYITLGTLALAALAIQGSQPEEEWIGYWVAVVTGLAVVVAGMRRKAERRAGWI